LSFPRSPTAAAHLLQRRELAWGVQDRRLVRRREFDPRARPQRARRALPPGDRNDRDPAAADGRRRGRPRFRDGRAVSRQDQCHAGGGATAAEAEAARFEGLTRQAPGAMGLGTSQQRMVPPTGWHPPPKPDPMTAGRSTRGRARKPSYHPLAGEAWWRRFPAGLSAPPDCRSPSQRRSRETAEQLCMQLSSSVLELFQQQCSAHSLRLS